MAQELVLISKERYDRFVKQMKTNLEDKSTNVNTDQTGLPQNAPKNEVLIQRTKTVKKRKATSSQTGGLFVIRNGKRDVLPGMENKLQRPWIKY